MKQQTLTGFEKYGKTTRRAQFLADMDRIVPWEELQAEICAPALHNGQSRQPNVVHVFSKTVARNKTHAS
jgi:hypothetical protein